MNPIMQRLNINPEDLLPEEFKIFYTNCEFLSKALEDTAVKYLEQNKQPQGIFGMVQGLFEKVFDKAQIEVNIKESNRAKNFLKMVRLLRVPTADCTQYECDRTLLLLTHGLVCGSSQKFLNLALPKMITLCRAATSLDLNLLGDQAFFDNSQINPLFRLRTFLGLNSLGNRAFVDHSQIVDKVFSVCKDISQNRLGAQVVLEEDLLCNYACKKISYQKIDDFCAAAPESLFMNVPHTVYGIWKFRKDSVFNGMPRDIIKKIIGYLMQAETLKFQLIKEINNMSD